MVPLGVDKEKLLLQADKLEGSLRRLNEAASMNEVAFVADDMRVSATERHIQIAVECCLNMGNHVIAGLVLKRADSYAQVFTRLEESTIIDAELAGTLRKAARFRNRVVHLYLDLTPQEVHLFCIDVAPVMASFVETVFARLREEGHLSEQQLR